MQPQRSIDEPAMVKVSPLSGCVGARIDGVQIGRETPREVYQCIRRAATEYGVVVLPNQAASAEDQVGFAKMWGELIVHPLYPSIPGHPEVLEIKNFGKKQTITEIWHSDTSSLPCPPSFSMLLARELPACGGDTMFASQYQAFEDFTPAMRKLLESLRATHASHSETSDHPVVRVHPETKRKALFVNGYFVKNFVGMTAEESKPLLDFLFAWAAKPEYAYRHRWTQGDLVIWDNRCVQHYAVHDYGDAPRRLHRVMVEGEAPA
jgi:taurine dioxygenase